MKRINSVGKWVAPMLVLLISIIIFFYTSTITYKNIGTNELFATVDAITRGYKIKQIIASVVLFIAGYLVAQGTFDKQTDAMKAAWAVPIAVVGWCMCSTVILLLRLPYIRSFAFGLVGALLGAVIYIRKEYIKKTNLGVLCRYIIWCAALSTIFSTGIVPTVMSSDSYYYVMQYGEVVAKVGSLNFDTAGATMTWTGVSSALISSLAYFCGFETITVIHNLLVISMLICFYLMMKKQISNLGARENQAIVGAGIFTVMLIVIPAFELLSFWVISNTYCMVYIFLLMIGMNLYTIDERENKALLILLSMVICWLTLSRAEMSVCMACIVCLISFLPLTQIEMLTLSVPMMVVQLLYLIELNYQQAISVKSVYDSMLTPSIQAIMTVATVGCVIYSFFINSKFFSWIRKKINIIVSAILPGICIAIYFLDKEKYVKSIESIIYNFKTQYWGYLPALILVLYIVIALNKKNNFGLIFSTGYVLINLILCLGRKQPLRNGYGDSCNRIMMSAIPVVFFALICSVLEIVALRIKENKEQEEYK